MKAMNYWNIQLHPNDMGWSREKELLIKHGVIGLGDWEEAAKQQPNFENTMQKGDIVLVKHGATIIALVEVTGDYEYSTQTDELLWFERRRKVKVLDWYNDTYDYRVSSRKTLERCVNPDTDTYISIKQWIQRINNKKNMETCINLLKANYNLILTGAPGTGKTYLAKQIAAQMILGKEYDEKTASDDEKEKMKEQCGFVQFHPSYDYTDFVEGLRPVKDKNNSQIGFERMDGIFKNFCILASENIENSQKRPEILSHETAVEKMYNNLLNAIESDEIKGFTLRSGDKKMLIEGVSDKKSIWLKTDNSESTTTYTVSLKRIKKLSNTYPNLESLESVANINADIRRTIGGCNASAYWAVLHYMYNEWGNIPSSVTEASIKPFVFIIDEINRGEISKIFGELFFSIDPGYRGEKGKIKTQYQNLISEDDYFENGFYVPENVYIIGTMNDIDRSVESMDFAMRRRFTFKEVCASDTVEMLKTNEELAPFYDDIVQRMNNLNLCILTIQGFTSAYQIGAAYYLKLANYLENGNISWNSLWDNHLRGLLFEYLRGLPNAEGDLKKLYSAYNMEVKYTYESGIVKQVANE